MVKLMRRNYVVNGKGLVTDQDARTRIGLRLVSGVEDVELM
jgi:hypothetical protein